MSNFNDPKLELPEVEQGKFSSFNEPKLQLTEIKQGKFTLVDSRYEDPIEYKINEYNQRTPTLNTIVYATTHAPGLPPMPQIRVNYGSYIYSQVAGSDASHPFGTSPTPFQQATF